MFSAVVFRRLLHFDDLWLLTLAIDLLSSEQRIMGEEKDALFAFLY